MNMSKCFQWFPSKYAFFKFEYHYFQFITNEDPIDSVVKLSSLHYFLI